MDFIFNFFVDGAISSPIAYEYSPSLVAASVVTAMVGSALALYLTQVLRLADTRLTYMLVRLCGAIAFGGSVWSMHFFGMLAFSLCVNVTYDPWITLMSGLPAIIAAWIAIGWITKPRLSTLGLLYTSILIGGGIGFMHYMGMMAMQMTALLRFDPFGFALSIFAAVSLSACSLWTINKLHTTFGECRWEMCAVGGIGFGLAISAMHYIGMSAARFIGTPETATPIPPDDKIYLSSVVILGLFGLLGNVFSGGLITTVRRGLVLLNQQNTELEDNHKMLKQQQAIMLKNEKLATLGTLSAGIAHEINNPLAYVSGNLSSLKEYVDSLRYFVNMIKGWRSAGLLTPDQEAEFERLSQETDLAFLEDDVGVLLADTIDGSNRITEIVKNLKSFSRTDKTDRQLTNLNTGLKSTLRLLNSKLDAGISIDLKLHSKRSIVCNPNEINQVFLNLILNARQAIDKQGTIRIETYDTSDEFGVRIADTGNGIPAEIIERIFDPFYTTKPPGEGTGMGLAIVYGIIGDHGGTVSVKSKPGTGTTFDIRLPYYTAEDSCQL
ncbi:MAG: hypothetical protein GYB20_02835 [Oceanospirillales bacterium]|nr:hypothetical protein [Oceanospirillales bacterium]MBR9886627.1 hypothetical protein [Oceanospirillales bacterium]